MAQKLPNLQKELRLRESHLTRSWSCRTPSPLAHEITCPEIRLDVGALGSDDIHERRSTKHKLRNRDGCRIKGAGIHLTHYDMLPYLRIPDCVRKARHGARAGDLLSERWDNSRL